MKKRWPLLTFILCDSDNSAQRTEETLRTLLREHLRKAPTEETLIACYRGANIHIFNLYNDRKITLEHTETIRAFTFLNGKHLVVAGKETFCVYNIETTAVVATLNHYHPCIVFLVVMQEYVLFNESYEGISCWNTKTNELIVKKIDADVLEVIPLNDTKFIMACGSQSFIISDVSLSNFEYVNMNNHNDQYSCGVLSDHEVVFHDNSLLSVLDLQTKQRTDIMKAYDGTNSAFIKVVDQDKVIVLGPTLFCSLYDLKRKCVLVKEFFQPQSSDYSPFCVKKSLVFYYDKTQSVKVFDVQAMRIIREFQVTMNQECEDAVNLAVW
jgi:hypothetical protein